jgi:hypothetical protein
VDLDAELALLTAGGLSPMVRELLQDPDARARTWDVERVGWVAVNPGTLGIFRVRGVADTGGGQRPFSLVFKAVADLDLPGFPDTGYMHEPQDWNYWKREPLAFASGLLNTYRGTLVPVRCVGVEDRGDVAFMWLEELHDDGADDRWAPERHVQAAQHLGRFNGDHVHNLPSVSTYPWLCQGFTHGLIATLTDFGTAAACKSDDKWRHPALRNAFPRPLGSRVADLLADADELLAVGANLPLALTHHDAHRDNMFRRDSRGTETTQVLDWGFLGLAPIGEDLGHQVGINVFHQYIAADNASQYEQAAASAYLSGLREARLDPDANCVRTYARAVAALQLVSFAAAHVAWLSEDGEGDDNATEPETPWPAAWAAERGMDIDQLMGNWAAAFDWFLNLGDDARRAAETL